MHEWNTTMTMDFVTTGDHPGGEERHTAGQWTTSSAAANLRRRCGAIAGADSIAFRPRILRDVRDRHFDMLLATS